MYNQLKPTQELSAGIISFKIFQWFHFFWHKIGGRNIKQVITPEMAQFELQLNDLIRRTLQSEISL
jgi:hypothetical protein